ncbi:MAG TPA: tetratricopeptide repeat protein [Longimicrobiales bacterium]
MIDAPRVLRPLSEAGDAIDRLVTYERPADLAGALEATWTALDRSLRLLLRSDTSMPEEHRLSALAPDEMPLPRLIEALRQRNLISMELAGRVHELAQAAQRAASGDVRASDADVARGAVTELRREVSAAAESPVQEAAHQVVATGAVEEPPQPVPPPRRRPSILLGLVLLAVLALVATALYLAFGRGDPDAAAVAAFKEGRLPVAEQGFRASLQKQPGDVVALLYLARIYRREGRLASADTMLAQAVHVAPDDPDVRRERGHLLMAAGKPGPAALEYERAVKAQPDEKLNWMALVQALRAANDPRVDQVIQRAPADIQPLLTAVPAAATPLPGATPGGPTVTP